MKKLHLLVALTVFLLILSACAPAANPLTTPTEPALPSPVVTEAPATEEPENLGGDLSQTPTEPPSPPAEPDAGDDLSSAGVDWDTSPEAQVIKATFCCGFVHPLTSQNYVPAAIVYGDGRILWSTLDDQGKRQVQVGQLDADQMNALMEEMVSAGFLDWEELYTDPMSPTDLPSQCITLNLGGQSKQVCEYFKGAPQAFHDLYDRLAAGAGVAGQPFKPQVGFMRAETVGPQENADVPEWDAESLGVSLANATEGGINIEGPALELAWELVNANSWGPTVREDGQLYQIALKIPGVNLDVQ